MKQIRESKFSKIVAYYLILNLVLQITAPMQMYALTSGPTQPEFNSFTPIGTSDMVDLASGDFNYNIPIMDVGGYPLNLSYNSGITMDQEASWVGLGWNLNVGQIERQVRGLPDDFRGDEVVYENNMRQNRTVGLNLAGNAAVFGVDALNLGVGLGVEVNNYEGISFKPSYGIGFQFNDNVSVGLNFSTSLDEGATVVPSVAISQRLNKSTSDAVASLNTSMSLGLNSRKGIENLNLSASVSQKYFNKFKFLDKIYQVYTGKKTNFGGIGGSINFNDQSFTPSKRVGYKNSNFSFNASLGGEIIGAEGQVQFTGYGSYQNIADDYKHRVEKAFGYENTEYKAEQEGVLDFNRENEIPINKNTTTLPVTNYTYDLYSIAGQGVSGQFRPYKSQVGFVYNDYVKDQGDSDSFGVEVGLGSYAHGSGDFKAAPSETWTGPWQKNNNVLPYFRERYYDKKKLGYEPHVFKMVGGVNMDPEIELYKNKLVGNKAINIKVNGYNKNSYTEPFYLDKNNNETPINAKIKREKRFIRNQLVYKVSKKEAINDPQIITNPNASSHHTAGFKILKTDGSCYVFGNTAYNINKVEATFDVSGSNNIASRKGNNTTGLVGYNGNTFGNESDRSDMFLNKITTKNFAHSYMLTSVLSSDYEDVDDNGPSINDLGSYTKFEYELMPDGPYKWRVPFQENKATYNEGLISKAEDQKGNYIYGEKELKYIKRIITKTHVAFFDLGERKDAIGTNGENGGKGSGRMRYLKSIRLYSLPEVTNTNGQIVDPTINGAIKPIKTAHFEYTYELCKKMPNNIDYIDNPNINNPNHSDYNPELGGKLTLKKVYFTYRGSNMGKYTPYEFNYGEDNPVNNPNYDMKGFDIWGFYKKNPENSGNVNTELSNTEFPYVEQDKEKADKNAQAWNLKQVKLPSGGIINIEIESDDYQFVQDKKAMQMFKVIGAGNYSDPSSSQVSTKELYNGNIPNKYIYVKIAPNDIISTIPESNRKQWFINRYLSKNYAKPIQFKFMLNMKNNDKQYEYISGYFKINDNLQNPINVKYDAQQGTIAAIPLEFLKLGGSINRNAKVNPISKAGWNFGRTYLNRLVYGLNDDPTETNFKAIIKSLEGSIRRVEELFKGPNKPLQEEGCARIFKPKSWIRLENPDGRKFGGGVRVKSIKLSDEWSVMAPQNGGTNMEYGQSYSYNEGDTENESAKSSGVATFEPNANPENPIVEPFTSDYNGHSESYAESIAAPRDSNYFEKPFGVSFFPSASVTYARVSVKNIIPKEIQNRKIKKHATGNIVTEFFTTRNFPTKVEFTNINMINDMVPNNVVGSLVRLGNVSVRNHLTMSQGFSIETNDMDGKTKSETVYDENGNKISRVNYNYNVDSNGNLDNNLTTVDEKGKVEKRIMGMDYDVINDFNESHSATTTSGFKVNIATIPILALPVPVPMILPESSYNENQLRTAVTTKHIHKTGVLIEKIAEDLGSSVSTKNLAWDANSGEVLLTETVNEYGDHYYSFTYPAYWMYEGMGPASVNIGVEGVLKRIPDCAFDPKPYFKIMDPINTTSTMANISSYFKLGDELLLEANQVVTKVWVLGYNSDKTGLLLINREGDYIDNCGNNLTAYNFKIVRSGNRNLQSASMASITSMINPLKDTNGDTLPDIIDQNSFTFNSNSTFNPRIINSSAVVYNDFWKPQNDMNVPSLYLTLPGVDPNVSGEVSHPFQLSYNPYLWNTKGEWRAEKSYAYLTGRNSSNNQINNPRNEGFYKNFSPFYQLINGSWTINTNNWTYASSVTQFSPFGMELENKDALNRYSAAQYGYQNKLPMAVASNARYREIGYEGFEESQTSLKKHFAFSGGATGSQNPVTISTAESHTGKRSVKVAPNAPIKIVKSLMQQVTIATPIVCSYDCNQLVSWNITDQNRNLYDNINEFAKYRLASICGNYPITGISNVIDDDFSQTGYQFTPTGNPNQIELTIFGYHDPRTNNGQIPGPTEILIPIKVNGVNTTLKYIYPVLCEACATNSTNVLKGGTLQCP